MLINHASSRPPTSSAPAKTFSIPQSGTFTFDSGDGSLLASSPWDSPDISALLGEAEAAWHLPPRRWGKGFIITSSGSARWHLPEKNDAPVDPLFLRYSMPRSGVSLTVARVPVATGFEEEYTISNDLSCEVAVESLAISVPIRDVYPSAAESLKGAFHAHVWTGGTNSWVWAQSMNGRSPGFGLDLLEGSLSSYSIESRDQYQNSNIRGHLYLHVTDHARNPEAFGGQSVIRLAPGENLKWRWKLSWHPNFESFQAGRTARDFSLPEIAAHVGEPLIVDEAICHAFGAKDVEIGETSAGSTVLTSSGTGIRWIEAGSGSVRKRAALLFHRKVKDIVAGRVQFILNKQQAVDGEPTREGAFLCYDNKTGLTELGGSWGDWSDGRERLAMPLLVQQALKRGWAGREAEEALDRFKAYASQFLLAKDFSALNDSYGETPNRLYNFPWMSDFYRNEYLRTGQVEDLRTSADILRAYYDQGGAKFLAFLHAVDELLDLLRLEGEEIRCAEIQKQVIAHATKFEEMDIDLPTHEVNYEQSIVAPLAHLLINAQKLQPQKDMSKSIEKVLTWLQAFEGGQPDARLLGIPIRHWDGYWFGRNRHWGDVFPHHWSVLSGGAYFEAASLFPSEKTHFEKRANRIFRSNLVNFQDDGSASCAFVYPSCVNGQPTHYFDPLVNDQDWSLVWLLRYADRMPWLLY